VCEEEEYESDEDDEDDEALKAKGGPTALPTGKSRSRSL